MFWGPRKDEELPEETPKPHPRSKLPPQLQQMVDRDDAFYDDIYSP